MERISHKRFVMMEAGLACLLATIGTPYVLTAKSNSDVPDKVYFRYPGKNIFLGNSLISQPIHQV